MRLIRGEGYIRRRIVVLVALALIMFIVGGESARSDNHQFLLCSGPGETKRANGDAAVAGDYIIVVNSRNFEAITDANDQVPEDTITEDDVQTSGGSFVRSDLSWGMYVPSGYVYQEAGGGACVINLKVMMREQGQDYFKEAVVDFDNTAPCQGRLWLNTSRDTTQDAAVCPQGAPASTSGTNTEDNTNNNGGNSDGNTNTNDPLNPAEDPDNSNNGGNPGNNNGGNPGNNNGGNPGNTGGGGNPGNTGGGGNGGGGTTPGGNTGGGGTDSDDTDDDTPGDTDGSTSTDDSDSQTLDDSSLPDNDTTDQSEEDLLESQQDDSQAGDLMEEAGDGSDSEDMLQTEEESGDRDTELRPQETVRPDAPKTGTGGIAANRDSSRWTIPIAAAGSLAVLMAVIVMLVHRRFSHRRA